MICTFFSMIRSACQDMLFNWSSVFYQSACHFCCGFVYYRSNRSFLLCSYYCISFPVSKTDFFIRYSWSFLNINTTRNPSSTSLLRSISMRLFATTSSFFISASSSLPILMNLLIDRFVADIGSFSFF